MSPFIKFARLQLPLIFAANRLHATDVIQRKKLNDIFVKQLKQKKEKRLQKKKKKLSKQKKVATIVLTMLTVVLVVPTGIFFYFRSSSKKGDSPLHKEFTIPQPDQPEEPKEKNVSPLHERLTTPQPDQPEESKEKNAPPLHERLSTQQPASSEEPEEKNVSPLHEIPTTEQSDQPEAFEKPLKTLGSGYFGIEPIGKLDIKAPKKEGAEVFYIHEIRGDGNPLFHATAASLVYQLSHKEDAVEYTLEKVDLIVEKAKICVEKITNWKKNLEDLRDNFDQNKELYRGYFDKYYRWYIRSLGVHRVDTEGRENISENEKIPSKFLEKIDCYLKENLLFHTMQNSFGLVEEGMEGNTQGAEEFLAKNDDEKKNFINTIFEKRIEIIEEILPHIIEVANSESHERVKNIFEILFSKSNLAEQLEWFNNQHDSIVFLSDWLRKVAFMARHLFDARLPQEFISTGFFQEREYIKSGTWLDSSFALESFRPFNLMPGILAIWETNEEDPLSLENFLFRIIAHPNKSPYQNDVIIAMGRYGSTSGQMNSFRLGILKGKMRKPYPTQSN